MSKPSVIRRKLSDLIPDARNANAGTERGLAMLDDSLRDYGAGWGVLLDRNGKIIAGNKTVQRAVGLGLENVVIVPTDGKTLVATQRVDLDVDDPKGRALAIADNRVSEVDLSWNADELKTLMDESVDLARFFDVGELEGMNELSAILNDVSDQGSAKRQLGGSGKVTAVIYCDDLSVVERAIRSTGEKNRGKALTAICKAYLDEIGQFDL